MRTWGRVTNPDGSKTWVKVETSTESLDDEVYLTTLCQVFLLNVNESPFYCDWGLPAQQSIMQQVQPDFYVSLIQQRFSQYFANILVAKEFNNPPTYKVNVTFNNGAKVSLSVTPQ